MTCVQLALIFVFSNSVEVFFKDSLIFKSLVTIKLLFFQTCVMISFNIIVCSVIVSCTTLRVFKVSLGSKIGFLFSWEKSSFNFNKNPRTHKQFSTWQNNLHSKVGCVGKVGWHWWSGTSTMGITALSFVDLGHSVFLHMAWDRLDK